MSTRDELLARIGELAESISTAGCMATLTASRYNPVITPQASKQARSIGISAGKGTTCD